MVRFIYQEQKYQLHCHLNVLLLSVTYIYSQLAANLLACCTLH